MYTTMLLMSPKSLVRHEQPAPEKAFIPVSPSEKRAEKKDLIRNAFLAHPGIQQLLKEEKYEEVYAAIAHHLDKNGFQRFFIAEDYTGVDIHTFFYTEDNLGYFEEATGNTLLDWLECAAFGVLGWKVIQDGYEKVASQSINKDSEEYKQYRAALHKSTVYKLLGLEE